MFRFHFRSALRGLRRSPAFSLINIVGLAAGMGCFMLIALYVQDEERFDTFHANADRIVRVTSHYTEGPETRSFARSVPAIGPTIKQAFPEVEASVRLKRYSAAFKVDGQLFQEDDAFFAEGFLFDIFDFPMVVGDPESALDAPNTIVLTQSTARRWFGMETAIGKEVVMSDTLTFTVTGIVEDVPARSHLTFNLLLSFETYQRLQALRGRDLDNLWSSGTYYTYALLSNSESAALMSPRLQDYVASHMGRDGTGVSYNIGLQPLKDIHLHSNLRQELGPNGSRTYNLIFSAIAVFILLVSCINFVNLATARSTRKAREVGVRKSLGAEKRQLVAQFLAESTVMSAVSLVLATVMVVILLPVMNELSGKSMSLSWADHWPFIPAAVGLGLLVSVLSGSYPAFFLSSFRPVSVLKGAPSTGAGGAAMLRRSLVVFQFTLSIAIIAATVVAVQQIDFMRNRSLGFDQEHVAVIPFSWDSQVQDRLELLKEKLLEDPDISSVTASGDVPGRMFTSMSYWMEGMPEDERGGINALIVDPDFAETYGLEMLSGRDFDSSQRSALGESFVLNEAAVRMLGTTPEEVIGKRFHMNTTGPVIGVVKDFNFAGLQNELEPLAMTVWPSWFGYVSLRIESNDLSSTLASVETTWKKVNPSKPYELFFLDDDFNRLYESEARFERLFMVFSGLSILISCLGLLGLALFTAERRRREIGIRKVMGASVSGIVLMLNRETTWLILVAALLATPLSWWMMDRWLATFAYRIDLSAWVFFGSAMAAMTLTWATVGWLSFRSAAANPVDAMRLD